MKKYFDFTLAGKVLFPLWILYWILVLVPRVTLDSYKKFFMADHPIGHFALISFFVVLFMLAAGVVIHYYIYKLYIDNSVYDKHAFRFKASLKEYLGMFIPNFLLTLITLTIYFPWFIKAYARFFVENTEFKGKGLKFLSDSTGIFIAYVLVFVPTFATSMFIAFSQGANPSAVDNHVYIVTIVEIIFMIPASYLAVKWFVDIQYNEYHVYLTTKFLPAFGKILAELFLTVITLGIYFPVMYVKLYEYFAARTVAEKAGVEYRFGFEKDNAKDFLFLWGQTLLIIITLGIYAPWAISKIGKLFLGRTYLLVEEKA